MPVPPACGQPYGPNGEKPSETPRVKRQIIFPDDKEYKRYLGILLNKGSLIDPRDRPVSDMRTMVMVVIMITN